MVMGALPRILAAFGAVLLVLAGGGVASARTSTLCPGLPGRIVAASPTLEVSRSRVPFGVYGSDGSDVYRACVLRAGASTERFLVAPGSGVPATVKIVGGYVAVLARRPDGDVLSLFDPAWDLDGGSPDAVARCPSVDAASGACVGRPFRIRGFALDPQGRVAWIESYLRSGHSWVRLRVRTEAGFTRTIAQRRGPDGLAGVRFAGETVRWSAAGRVHRSSVGGPGCRLGADARLLTRTRDIVVAMRPEYPDVIVIGCLRSDPRWRPLFLTNTESSHGVALTNVLTAGSWVAVNHTRDPEADGTFVIVDLRSGRRDSRLSGFPPTVVDALAPDGRYIFHASPDPPVSTRLYATGPGKPDVQLDEGGPSVVAGLGLPVIRVFTDVQIDGGIATWKNAGVVKRAPLP